MIIEEPVYKNQITPCLTCKYHKPGREFSDSKERCQLLVAPVPDDILYGYIICRDKIVAK